jgi:protein-export membrane protein SecD
LVNFLPHVLPENLRNQLPDFMPKKTINLGLDLQGGSHLVLSVDLDAYQAHSYLNTRDEVRVALQKERLNFRNLQADGKGVRFVAFKDDQVPAIETALRKALPQMAISHEGQVVSLQFKPEEITRLQEYAIGQTLEILRSRVDEFGVAEPVIQRQGATQIIIQLPGIQDANRAKGVIGRTAQLTFHMVVEGVDPNSPNLPYGSEVMYEIAKDKQGGEHRIPYVLEKKPAISGENLAKASSGFDQMNQPAVLISFDARGTRKFAELTTANVGKRMAIVLDGQVYSAPALREPILGGSASITGNFTVQESEDLATVLRAGALPAPIKIIEERTIGPSLGKDSVDAGQKAVMIGMGAIIVLMLLCYGGYGMVANIALLANLVLIIAVMTAIGATMTLPGIAGIVLTIGTAIDANVLIFERIREESRNGKTAAAALESGFTEASTTIFDANVTNLISALTLFAIGSGPIKGFALTLTIGVACSVFTAILLSRYILVHWLPNYRPGVIYKKA